MMSLRFGISYHSLAINEAQPDTAWSRRRQGSSHESSLGSLTAVHQMGHGRQICGSVLASFQIHERTW